MKHQILDAVITLTLDQAGPTPPGTSSFWQVPESIVPSEMMLSWDSYKSDKEKN